MSKVEAELDRLATLAVDVATTSGTTIRMIFQDKVAMEFLATRPGVLEGSHALTGECTLAEHVACAQTELDAYDTYLAEVRGEQQR